MDITKDVALEVLPWLVFKLKNQYFAIKSEEVNGIFRLNQEVTPMKETSDYLRGVINVRGNMVPLLELRKVFGMESFVHEHDTFSNMMDLRMQEHRNWVLELKRCVKDNDIFNYTTDPHQCALGKWYDNYKTDNNNVRFHLNKIDEPHQELHKTAKRIFEEQEKGKDSQQQVIDELLSECEHEYMQSVLTLLEQTKEVLKDSYREMCITVTNDDKRLGVIVDQVVSVEMLKLNDCQKELAELGTNIIQNIAESKNVKGQIMVINTAGLFECIKKQTNIHV